MGRCLAPDESARRNPHPCGGERRPRKVDRRLILDEMGYLPMSREEASLFFRLLSRRCEKASLVITSNKSFTDWGEVFRDQVLDTVILDRLLGKEGTIQIGVDTESRRAVGRANA